MKIREFIKAAVGARGAYEVDCDWKDGKPVRVAVRAKKGGKPEVRFAGRPVRYDDLASIGKEGCKLSGTTLPGKGR